MSKPVPLSPDERAELVKRIRFELGLRRGQKVTQAEFAGMVSDLLKLDRPLHNTTATGWEKGAEPGFLAGCAIAHLGGLPAEALAFKPAGGARRPGSEDYVPPPTAPLKKVAERSGFPQLKGRPITPAPAKKRRKGA